MAITVPKVVTGTRCALGALGGTAIRGLTFIPEWHVEQELKHHSND